MQKRQSEQGHAGPAGARRWAVAALVPVLLPALLAGCSDRERPTFPAPSDGEGPVTTIDRPTADTVVTAGADFFVNGRVRDPEGIDSVYYEIVGGLSAFPPFSAEGDEEVRFGLPITTNRLQGETISVTVFGVDVHGNRGTRVTRQLFVQ